MTTETQLTRSARRVGVRIVEAAGRVREEIVRYVVRRRRRVLDVHRATVECKDCGARWLAVIRRATGRPAKGWRRCPNGCNAGRLARG